MGGRRISGGGRRIGTTQQPTGEQNGRISGGGRSFSDGGGRRTQQPTTERATGAARATGMGILILTASLVC